MSTAPIDPDYATNKTPIHFARVFRFGAPVLCGSTDGRTPATSDPRYVNCPACLARMTPGQRELRRLQVERYG